MAPSRALLAAPLALAVIALGGPALAEPSGADQAPAEAKKAVRPVADVVREVDALMAKGWAAAKVTPRESATDAELLRRLSLDLTGSIPDEAQVRAFLASQDPARRQKLAAELVRSDGFARTTALRWGYLLVGREYLLRSMDYKRLEAAMGRMVDAARAGRGGKGDAGKGEDGPSMGGASESDDYASSDGPVPPLVGWLEGRLRENAGWGDVVRDLITATGASNENPATHYALRFQKNGKASEFAGNAMRNFQGIQIQCAECHDHPYTAWKQTDFWGVAAFFGRVGARREKPPEGEPKKQMPYIVFDQAKGQTRLPAPPGETGALALPKFITGEVCNPERADRRAEVARMITDQKNPYFAKATVNRFWQFLFGRGIIDPVDDLETKDYPHPEVLALLERDFKESGYDVRRLTEVMVSTRAYQLSSAGPEETREAELALFARAPLRSLSAEQVFYSVLSATGAEDVRTTDVRQRVRLERMKFQLLRKFLQTFNDDEGEEVVEEGTIPQALLLLNGPLTNDAVRPRAGHPVYDRLFRMESVDERIDTLYLRTLSRTPTAAERRTLRDLLAKDENKVAAGMAQVYADITWALLNSSEFALNH